MDRNSTTFCFLAQIAGEIVYFAGHHPTMPNSILECLVVNVKFNVPLKTALYDAALHCRLIGQHSPGLLENQYGQMLCCRMFHLRFKSAMIMYR